MEKTDTLTVLETTIQDRVIDSAKMIRALGVEPAVFETCALNALVSNPRIAQCTPDSLDRAILKCAQLGLVPDGREAVIVPFKSEATLIPMIEGRLKLARAATPSLSIRVRAVFAADEWEYCEGLVPVLNHVPSDHAGVRTADKLVAVYALASIRDGDVVEFEVLFRGDVDRYRARSLVRDQSKGPWAGDYVEMAKKNGPSDSSSNACLAKAAPLCRSRTTIWRGS